MSYNAEEARGEFALRALSELKNSPEAAVVGNAGWIAGQYGLILNGILQGRFTVDYFPMAEELLKRAHQLDQDNSMYPSGLEQIRKLRDVSAGAK